MHDLHTQRLHSCKKKHSARALRPIDSTWPICLTCFASVLRWGSASGRLFCCFFVVGLVFWFALEFCLCFLPHYHLVFPFPSTMTWGRAEKKDGRPAHTASSSNETKVWCLPKLPSTLLDECLPTWEATIDTAGKKQPASTCEDAEDQWDP